MNHVYDLHKFVMLNKHKRNFNKLTDENTVEINITDNIDSHTDLNININIRKIK